MFESCYMQDFFVKELKLLTRNLNRDTISGKSTLNKKVVIYRWKSAQKIKIKKESTTGF